MEYAHLSSTVAAKTISEDATAGVFEIEGLYAGYGLTLGNALRRTLLSSLPGAAVTYIKVKNASHEFSTLPGMKEDLIELLLNFKKLRFRMDVDEPQVLTLSVKGERVVTAADIETTTQAQIVNPDVELATLTAKDATLDIEITVERGLGYSPAESRKAEKLPIGVIAVDAFFSPVTAVNYTAENMRVGDRTDYNRLRLEIMTDGTVSPSSALHKAGNILKDHFEKAGAVEVKTFEASEAAAAPKKRSKKEKAS
ncbi:MAG: DNA-directed RNA polymerase subunit alpha [bacterium]|nr:DNA-directed RNA polymerase subunit alpha [bacterium]